MNPEVTIVGFLDLQVCVPKDWADARIIAFAEATNPCGTTHGWQIRTDEERLAGDPVRQPCGSCPGYVHVMLDA